MKVEAKFVESKQSFKAKFGEVHDVSDGGYERGYEAGLAERSYETWTITLMDGTIVEKEIALL